MPKRRHGGKNSKAVGNKRQKATRSTWVSVASDASNASEWRPRLLKSAGEVATGAEIHLAALAVEVAKAVSTVTGVVADVAFLVAAFAEPPSQVTAIVTTATKPVGDASTFRKYYHFSVSETAEEAKKLSRDFCINVLQIKTDDILADLFERSTQEVAPPKAEQRDVAVSSSDVVSADTALGRLLSEGVFRHDIQWRAAVITDQTLFRRDFFTIKRQESDGHWPMMDLYAKSNEHSSWYLLISTTEELRTNAVKTARLLARRCKFRRENYGRHYRLDRPEVYHEPDGDHVTCNRPTYSRYPVDLGDSQLERSFEF